MNETTKTETEKTDPTRKTTADAGAKPIGMMTSAELDQHIETLSGQYRARVRTLRALARAVEEQERAE